MKPKALFIFLLSLSLSACGGSVQKSETRSQAAIEVPSFSADSAYGYVAEQVAFGPRVPNTSAHKECAHYLHTSLERMGAKVVCQEASLTAFDGSVLNATNITPRCHRV